jgi:hypothetical protein
MVVQAGLGKKAKSCSRNNESKKGQKHDTRASDTGAGAVCDQKILVLCSKWKNPSRLRGWGEVDSFIEKRESPVLPGEEREAEAEGTEGAATSRKSLGLI